MFWTFEYERKSVHKAEILIKGINLALIKMMITIITIIEELLYNRQF